MLRRQWSPRCVPSHPRSVSGTPGGLRRAGAPEWGMLSPFPLCASQEPPPQPPGAGHRLHQPRLLHLRGGPQLVASGPRRNPQEASREPGRGPAVPEPRCSAGPVTLGGGAVVWPAPLRATEPLPRATTQPSQSGPPQETQVGRPDEGHGGAGRLLAVCGHSAEPAGAGVTAALGGQTGGPSAPAPPGPGAATAALPGGAEAAREARSSGCFGPGGSTSSSRRPAACQDVTTAVPSPVYPHALGSCSPLLCSDRFPGGLSPQRSICGSFCYRYLK